jgi:hypothetical protein
MSGGRRKARISAQEVVVGAEDVLGQRLICLNLAIEPFCSYPKQSGHRGMHCQGAVDAIGPSVMWYCYTCGLTFRGGNTGGWGKGYCVIHRTF